jgi:hypothetical protein
MLSFLLVLIGKSMSGEGGLNFFSPSNSKQDPVSPSLVPGGPSDIQHQPETSVNILPFEPNCASVQAYFNSIPWNTPTEFKGFESSEYIEYISRKTGSPTDIVNTPSWALCSNGYIIESSPMGTRVCKGNIEYQYHINSSKPSQRYWKANSSSDCRWK